MEKYRFRNLPNLPSSLLTLDVHDQFLENISSLNSCPNLINLSLNGNILNSEEISKCSKIENLVLNCVQIKDFNFFSKLERLRTLRLKFLDYGVIEAKSLENNRNLTFLEVDCYKFDLTGRY